MKRIIWTYQHGSLKEVQTGTQPIVWLDYTNRICCRTAFSTATEVLAESVEIDSFYVSGGSVMTSPSSRYLTNEGFVGVTGGGLDMEVSGWSLK